MTTTSDEEREEANEHVRDAWQVSVTARIDLIDRQIEKMQRDLNGLRESLKGVCEP